MSFTRALSASLILSTALTVGACKGDNKSGLSDYTSSKAIKVDAISSSDVQKMFSTSSRKVSDKEASEALMKLGMADKSQMMSWAERSGSNGNYTYTDFTAKGEDGQAVSVGKLELSGVHMKGEAGTFDILKAYDLQTQDDDAVFGVEKIELSGPSPAMAEAITRAIAEGSNLNGISDMDLNIDWDDEDIYFDAINIEGLSFSANEGTGTLKQLAWGEVDDTGRGLFMLEGLALNVQKNNTPEIRISLESISARGIDMAAFKDVSSTQKRKAAGPNGPMAMLGGNNAFAKTFDTASFKNLDIEIDTLSIRSDGGQGSAQRKGNLTTIQQVLQPLTIKFSAPPRVRERSMNDPDAPKPLNIMKQFYDMVQTLGYDEMVVTSSQTSTMNDKTGDISVDNSYLDLKDGFRFSYNLEANALPGKNSSPEEAVNGLKISRLDLSLEDKSIVDRGLKLAAKQQGTSKGLIKMQAKGGLMLLAAMTADERQQEALGQLSQAFNSFIDDGGTFKVGINPEMPIRATDLQSMDPTTADLAALGFYVRTE